MLQIQNSILIPLCGFFLSIIILRFVLEPKSVLINEQEQKFKDSETAIASLQVLVLINLFIFLLTLGHCLVFRFIVFKIF